MEGKKAELSRTSIAIAIILLFHAVGLTGFFIGGVRPLFLRIVPFHLLLMLGVLLYSYGRPAGKLLWFGGVVYLIGFVAEWIGVHRGWPFGDYSYGHTLGVKLFDIPLTMGINWFMLVYAVGATLQYIGLKWPPLRVLAGAAILTVLDILIEPIAQRFDYWHWAEGHPPLKNYAGWLAVSLLCLILFELFKFKRPNLAAVVLLIVQFLFFGLLQWV